MIARTLTPVMLMVGLSALGCVAPSSPDENVDSSESAIATIELGQATNWVEQSRVLTVKTEVAGALKLVQNPGTIYGIEDPNLFPPGECKNIATQWATSVKNHDKAGMFRLYLGWIAQHTCNVTFVRGAVADATGAFPTVQIQPSP